MADTSTRLSSGIGHSVDRPDGVAKVDGSFEFSNDLHHERMLWGATVRSPIPHGRIRSVDIGPALAMPGVAAVVTHEDVPGSPVYGLITHDQPVFASEVVRYEGEPRRGSQLEVFEKAPDGQVSVTVLRTDDEGSVAVPVKAGYSYMLDAVVLRVPEGALAEDRGAVWESLWANMTFAVPE